MFDKKDMMVSLVVAEVKFKELKEEYKESYDKLKNEFNDFINTTKAMTGYIGELTIRDMKCLIGYETGFEIDGIKVYTGDEIRLISKDWTLNGKVGVATMVEGQPYWRSNAECSYMQKGIKYEFVRHYIHYKHGEEVAKGRKGGHGFIVDLSRRDGNV